MPRVRTSGRTIGLGPSSYSSPNGATSTTYSTGPGAYVGASSTPEGRALLVLVLVELIVTGWLRAIFKSVHGG